MSQDRTEDEAAESKEKKRGSDLDLSIGQVLAATGATTVGAVLVKFLDIWGSVLGTAILSIFTSIGAVLILRTMRRTGDRIKSQITALSPAAKAGQAGTVELGGDPTRTAATAAVHEDSGTGDGAEALDAAEPVGDGAYVTKSVSRRRTLVAIVVSSVLVFGSTMGVLFLLGGLTGDPGRFVQQPGTETTVIVQTPEDETGGAEDEAETTPSEDATVESPSENASPTPTDEPSETVPTENGPTTGETPTEEPTGGAGGTEEESGEVTESPAPADEPATETPAAG